MFETRITLPEIRNVTAAMLIVTTLSASAIAQDATTPEALDAIIGSEVHQEEMRAEAEPQKVIAAIEKTTESTETVRTISKLDKVDIVFLSDSAKTEGGPPPPIEAKIEEHKDEIAALRDEIEGNAMLYHALDSRQVLVEDVLAIDFDGSRAAVIYAAAKPPR